MSTFQVEGKEVQILTPPDWDGEGMMVYTEIMPDGEAEPMVWEPETDEELTAARRFYGEAHYVRWSKPEELATCFEGPGPWLVRTNLTRQYQFLSTADEGLLFNEGDEDAEILTPSPESAARLSRADAERIILRFSQVYEYGPEAGLYVEPVPADDPLRDYGPDDPIAYALDLLARAAEEDDDAEE